MKVLSIDSSGLVASVAILTEEDLIGEYTIHHELTHSETLLPMLDELMKSTKTDPEELDGIAVAAGPGSFTGLRIGASTAKGIALALKKPLIPVSTLAALAYNLPGVYRSYLCPIMDARREQVYNGIYQIVDGELITIEEPRAIGVPELCDDLNDRSFDLIEDDLFLFLGDGVPVYRKRIDELLRVPHEYVPSHVLRQKAGSLGSLALRYLRDGKTVEASEFVPDYLRKSQAEREREEHERTSAGD